MDMKTLIYDQTYWNHKGLQPQFQAALDKLIPESGEVDNRDDNPALELYRIASNCYYDLYNNGLCNREDEFRRIFGFDGTGELTQDVVDRTEQRLNEIILAATMEQRIKPDTAASKQC